MQKAKWKMLSNFPQHIPCLPLARQAQRRAAALFTLLTLVMALAAPGVNAQANAPIGINNIIKSVDVVNGQLVATTTQGQPLPITTTAKKQKAGTGGCPILNLALGPINLNLLGLQVTTSPICLNVTGQPGPGNLLGNLLCAIAGLLDRGVPLNTILARLSPTQTSQLTSGLTDLLNQALNNLNQATVQTVDKTGACPILHLALGPLNLNLLGLVVQLDNCNNGPVTVDVTAIPGAGNLLGNLLCGVLALFNPGATLQAIFQAVLQAILNALPV